MVLPLEPAGVLDSVKFKVTLLQINRGVGYYETQAFFLTASFPYAFIADLMIAFYWQALMDRNSRGLSHSTVSLKKLKIPLITLSVLFILVDHISSSMYIY
jgi:hypothetical protein